MGEIGEEKSVTSKQKAPSLSVQNVLYALVVTWLRKNLGIVFPGTYH